MKYILLLFLASVLGQTAISQQTDTVISPVDTTDKMAMSVMCQQKAKKSPKVAKILRTGGLYAMGGGFLIGMFEMLKQAVEDKEDPTSTVGVAIFTIGAFSLITSIPFSIKGKNQRAKAKMYADQAVYISPGIKLPSSQNMGVRFEFRLGK